MINIFIPKEIKNGEFRVGLIPEAVEKLIKINPEKIKIWIQEGAGEASGYKDEDYQAMGAYILYESFKSIFEEKIDLILKVKEPLPEEYDFLLSGKKSVAGFFHLPANPGLEKFFKDNGIRFLDYGEVTDEKGGRPILAAMSKIAGELAVLKGFNYLLITGCGLMPQDTKVTIIGAGTAGIAAANYAANLGVKKVNISIFDIKEKMVFVGGQFINTKISSRENISGILPQTDLLICAPAIKGEQAPKIITRKMVQSMQKTAVIMDVAIDQGGTLETSLTTTTDFPFYFEEGVLHCCRSNIPGMVGRSASPALSKAALPYLIEFIKKLI